MSASELTITGPWPFVLKRWRGPYSAIQRVDVTWLGVEFWFEKHSPMTFRTRQQDDLLRALLNHGIQVGPREVT